MEKFIVTTGKTIDLAVAAALKELKLDRDNVSVEVLENAKSGFLGIGASPAKVKVTYEAPDEAAPEAPLTALSSASRSKPKERPEPTSTIISRPGKKIEPEQQAKPQRRREEPRQCRPERAEKPERPERPQRAEKPQRLERPQRAEKPQEAPVPAAPQRVYEPAPAGSLQERVEQFLTGLLQHMGSNAVPHAYMIDEETCRADLVGEDVGMLIGRRGDTLDAIQYLTSYAINHDAAKRVRISVDAGAYRQKREEALRQLARKMAGKAVKYHRNFTLEPMNAYERHVIHAALQDYPEVTTFSTGTEPQRRIVVAYAKEK